MAARLDLSAAEILIRRGEIPRDEYERRLAAHCGAGRLDNLPRDFAIELAGEADCDAAHAICRFSGQRRVAIAPQTAGYDATASAARSDAGAFLDCAFVGAADLRHAIFNGERKRFAELAVTRLRESAPEFSSSRRWSSGQIAFAAFLGAACAAGLATEPRATYQAIGAIFTLFYFGVVLLRAWFTAKIDAIAAGDESSSQAGSAEELPVYSVLVALYREENQAARLVEALRQIDWPADRLEVLFLCEAEDRPTIKALHELPLPDGFRVVVCPPGFPKTKPRALTFALPLASGEFCVIYDAEDRPHPGQLLESYCRFRRSGARLACLQAPLVVDNRSPNWLVRMFAMEYLAQFSAMLPLLEAANGPLPLGGTSNHFRTATLRACGGWDPFNMTEDADIGIRLARMGYACGTLRLPTFEEAPHRVGAWLRQRTRWLKGWIQTIFVHSRAPTRTLRSLGLKGSLLLHLVLTSIVVSMIAHPFFLAIAAFEFQRLARGEPVGVASLVALGFSVFNLVGGYTTHAAFLVAAHKRAGARFRWADVATLPAYWLLISLAGWRAVVQFLLRPFHWEKTAHGLAERQEFAHIAAETAGSGRKTSPTTNRTQGA
jgi:cellulose synthase/poly-beta-1,6-N-acetylglucosamine synthase-like glycosyltransferase